MPYNEQETRFWLIDPMLRSKGYADDQRWLKLETKAPVEASGPKGRRRQGGGRTDYLLCVQVGDMPRPLPVAVLEAKKENEDPLKGMQQAKGYADCTRFDVKYAFASNGHLYGEFDFVSGLQGGPTALNPNASSKVDERTPAQIIQNIQEQGRIVAESLSKLSTLLNRSH